MKWFLINKRALSKNFPRFHFMDSVGEGGRRNVIFTLFWLSFALNQVTISMCYLSKVS